MTKYDTNYFKELEENLVEGAHLQDQYDLDTINLIAPASPTRLKYFHDMPLRHNAIAEGLLQNRPYAGVEGFNRIEQIAVDAACTLFNAEHANVQPHSVSQANQAVYQALLEYGDTVLAMKFDAGGHLTHGMKVNFSGKFYDFQYYGIDENGWIDYDEVEQKALELKPKLIVCGGSSYPRSIDFERLAVIARKVGAHLLGDLCHPAGLIIADRFPQPFPHCDVVTLTLDKTVLGPHGGLILCKKDISEKIDKAVHPGVQSSVPLRRIYQIAQCLIDASDPWFQDFIDRLLKNMNVFEEKFKKYPGFMVTGGSDTHLMALNTRAVFGLTGKEAEGLLEEVDILANRQVVPGEELKPYIASGLRMGATWITARGYDEEDTARIADMMIAILENPGDKEIKERVHKEAKEILQKKRDNDVWKDEPYDKR